MNKPKAHIASYKKEEAVRVKNILQKYKVIAIADMTNMPSPQLQKLRSSTKESVFITMSKARIIKIVFSELKEKIKGIDQLKDYIRGMPALLLTNDNPFKLSKILKKSKSSAPAKAGQLAPNDLTIPAGPTPFPPGPFIGELAQLGVKASVVEGKIAVREDTVIVREGQPISGPVAALLTKLGMEPMEIGISLLAALEDGVVFNKQVLNFDEAEYLSNIKLAHHNAFNLAFSVAYPMKENIKLLIRKAFMDSNALADSKKILTSENVKKELAQANREAEVLKSKLNLPEVEVKVEEHVQEKRESKPEAEHKGNQEFINDEKIAQSVLKKLQDKKMTDNGRNPIKDKDFEKEEQAAQKILKKIQDDKIKREGKK